MLEESIIMDKKSLNRSSQTQPRASTVDSKKNTELNHRPLPRNNKKREGTGSASKNEPFRKNASSQRGRGQVDRRPRTRGPSGFVMGGAQNTGIDEDEDPEVGSVFVPGSKKQNLNHLLNFMLPSRSSSGPVLHRFQPRVIRRIDPDLYLRSNCQFVVKQDGDYKANILDPDVPMKWEQIEEIIVRSTGKSECPICLGTPAAGRAGSCGHVHCWACALHYAASRDTNAPPCPVCHKPLNVNNMKPTRMVQWDSPTEEVTMRLVRRLRGSTTVEIAPPRGNVTETETNPILPMNQIYQAPYAKLFYATKQEVFEILERERKEIKNQILAEIDTTEIVYLEQALEMLNHKEKEINTQFTASTINVESETQEEVPIVYEKQQVSEIRMDWFDVNEEGAVGTDIQKDIDQIQESVEQINLSETKLNPNANVFEFNAEACVDSPKINNTLVEKDQNTDIDNYLEIDKFNLSKYFYFYQAENGQQVFMNSLNVRVLTASWGAIVAAPSILRGRVLHRETFSLDDQMRKHMPYTAHLPMHSSFDVVELDIRPPYVTKEALDSFKEELDRRARGRQRQEREERRRERAARRAAEPPPRPGLADLADQRLFPPAAPPPAAPPPAAPPLAASSPPGPGPSFAKMASTSGTWRVRENAARAVTPPPPTDEPAAPRALSLSDAIEAALQASPAPATRKKKKSKKLFSMGLPHSG